MRSALGSPKHPGQTGYVLFLLFLPLFLGRAFLNNFVFILTLGQDGYPVRAIDICIGLVPIWNFSGPYRSMRLVGRS